VNSNFTQGYLRAKFRLIIRRFNPLMPVNLSKKKLIAAMRDWPNSLETIGYQSEVTLVLAPGNFG
jgi:hypothetical protein